MTDKNSADLNPNARPFVPVFLNNNNHQHTNNNVKTQKNPVQARCEQVVEILNEATELCDQLNNDENLNKTDESYSDQQFNDDELLEMLEMQEECRLEMMKFYIQAQNPTLFEEVYYGVSYPDQQQKQPRVQYQEPPQQQQQQQSQESENKIATAMDNLNLDNQNSLNESIDQVKKNLNPDASEFKPNFK